MADTGNTSTIAMATSGFTANCYVINLPEEVRDALEDSHLATATRKTFIPDDLVDSGDTVVEFEWNQSFGTFPPITGAAESITISFPLKSGESTPATFAGTGFLTRRKGPVLQNGEIMRGEYTVKWDGKTGPTYTAGS